MFVNAGILRVPKFLVANKTISNFTVQINNSNKHGVQTSDKDIVQLGL